MAFKFPTTVDDISNIPDDFKSLYSEEGTMLDSAAPVAKAFLGLSAAMEKQRKANEDLRKSKVDLSPLSGFGDSPAAILESFNNKISEFQNELAKGKDAKLNLDKLKEDMTKSHEKSLEMVQSKVNAYQAQLYSVLVENAATQAVAEAKGDTKLLLPFVKAQVKVLEEDGQLTPVVVDGAGDRKFNGVGAPMSIRELVSEMKSDPSYGKLFESEAPSGGGSRRSAAVGATKRADDMSSVDKISAGLKNNKSIYGAGA